MIALLVGAGIGAAAIGGQTKTKHVAGPTVHVPGPTVTVTTTETATAAPDTPSPPPTDTPAKLAVGQTLSVTSEGTPAADVTVTKLDYYTGPADEYSEGPKNGYLVVAHVKVKVYKHYTDGFDISSSDFYATAKGIHYDEGNGNAFEAPQSDEQLEATNLNAGEIGQGRCCSTFPPSTGRSRTRPTSRAVSSAPGPSRRRR
jgi:hypothetical protein